MSRILVTGSRDWEDWPTLAKALFDAVRDYDTVTVVSGACPTGADAMAEWVAENLMGHLEVAGVEVERHPADWYPDPDHKYDPTAGFKRNQEMVDLGADVGLGFFLPCRKPTCPKANIHPSHGSTDCAKRAEKAGIPVRRFGLKEV